MTRTAKLFLIGISLAGALLAMERWTMPQAAPNRGALHPVVPARPIQASVATNFGKLPLSFERNDGQTDSRVKFLSRGNGYTLFLTRGEAVLALSKSEASTKRLAEAKLPKTRAEVLRVRLANANSSPRIVGTDQLAGKANYFIGKDQKKWRINLPTYARVKYRNVYSGIDLVYHGSNQHQLEYDFDVAPGADPKSIRVSFEGAHHLKLDARGNLVIETTDGGDVIEHAPVIYQEVNGHRETVSGRYAILDQHDVGFRLAAYDTRKPLFIDPTLVYSTYLGGTNAQCFAISNSSAEIAGGIAVDSSGNTYITGATASTDFPTTSGAFQTSYGSGPCDDAFVTKLNADGSGLIYSTFLGGSTSPSLNSPSSQGNSISVDSSGSAYVTGSTFASNFPTSFGAFQATFPPTTDASFGQQVFVTKLTPDGSGLAYSTFLGGTNGRGDTGYAIAVEASGDAYVTGNAGTTNFPTTAGAFQTADPSSSAGGTGFVTKLNPTGTAPIYSSYLGGSSQDAGLGITVDSLGSAYVTGSSQSTDFPTTAGAFQTASHNPGGQQGFVAKFKSDGSGLEYSTYLGGSNGSGDRGSAIAVDSLGEAYVVGNATSTDFPVTAGAFQTSLKGDSDAFVTKLNPSGSALVFSTYLGGSSDNGGSGIAVDVADDVYVGGRTSSSDFPITASTLQPSLAGNYDSFISELNGAGSTLLFSTFLGGSGYDELDGLVLDSLGNLDVAGRTESSNFPVTPGAFQTSSNGGYDAFVARVSVFLPVAIEIKPTAAPPVPINPGAHGVTPVAILSTATFDATTIVPTSVTFDGGTPSACRAQDVNGDGINDLVCDIRTQSMSIPSGTSEATLTGQTSGGTQVQGQEQIVTVPSH